MPTPTNAQRASYVLLCAGPFLAIALAVPRALRIPGVHQTIGIAVFAIFAIATWVLAGPAIRSPKPETRLAAVAGMLLILPFALIVLFWVGLGPPWMAHAAENQMRYVVLVTSAAAVAGGFVVLKEVLGTLGESVFSTLGFAAIVLAAPLYLVGETLLLADYAAMVRTGQVPEVFQSLSEWQDILLFFGGALIYAAAAAFAISLSCAGWLGRGAGRAYAAISFVALIALLTRGLQFPDPAASSMPGYAIPGFIAGIPAVPFIIPCLLGVVSLRRAGLVEG